MTGKEREYTHFQPTSEYYDEVESELKQVGVVVERNVTFV